MASDINGIGFGVAKNAWFKGGAVSSSFVISVKTDNSGTSLSNQFTIPTTGVGYDYSIITSEHDLSNQTGSVTLTFATAGTYDIEISGDFPRIFFNGGGDRLKLLEIKQWGSISWTSMDAAFDKCANVAITAFDSPDLSNVTSMDEMFRECDVIQNENLNSWDVSNVTTMEFCFFRCNNFNCRIEDWDVSNVTNFNNFMPITPFNRDIGNWNMSSALNMQSMINDCDSFDQDISGWDINQVTNLGTFMTFSNGLSTSNYDALLIAWDAQGTMSYSGTVDFGGSTYTSGGAAETARTSLISKWGAITDGGAV